jgi:carbamoyltransferase
MPSRDFVYILGVPNFANYEASATLIRAPRAGGNIDYVCIGEDRLTRLKHTYVFPLRGIDYCLTAFGLESLEQVDYIYTDYARLPRWLNSGPGYRKLEHDYLKLKLNYPRERIRIVDHHDGHAASAYHPSGFDDAAVLVVDALGSELITQSLYHCKGSEVTLLERGHDWGIGRLYSLVTGAVLPYGPEKGFGKTMGLAPYGQIEPGPVLEFHARDSGMTTDYSAFFTRAPLSRIVAPEVRRCEDRERVLEPYFARAAYDVQQECERQMIRMACYAFEKTGSANICLAGGVALNGLANARVLQHSPFDNIWIQPGCSDTGVSMGLALWGYFQELATPESSRAVVSMPTPYTGRRYPDDEIRDLLAQYGVHATPVPPEEAGRLVADGKILGWFDGESEFGPRALGHRSIIADPRDPGMKDTLNHNVKFREGYRPYAPSILADHAEEWLELGCPSPFMLLVVPVREEKRSRVPAVTHVDNTTRPHTVTAEANPNYWRMIREFHRLTGVPMVLNTSMNVNREPIVEAPLDALICAFGTAIDFLYLQGLLIDCKRYANPELVKRLTAHRQQVLDDEWRRVTTKHLTGYNAAERDVYLAEENKIADWHRDYRSKYELERKISEWICQRSRVLLVGTSGHTRCLYQYVDRFDELHVTGLVSMDDLPGESADFDLYPTLGLDAVPWSDVDAVLVSTHEYQKLAVQRVRDVAPSGVEPVTIYDDAGDSLMFVLPQKWPVMNPFEHVSARRTARGTQSVAVDFDFRSSAGKLAERYALIVNYHYCHPEGGFPKGANEVRPEDLDRQLKVLKQNFAFTTIGELLNPKADLPEAVAIITFDDGLKDVAEFALPVLQRWDVPANVFCCSAPLIEKHLLDVHKTHLLRGQLGMETFRKEFMRLLGRHDLSKIPSVESLGFSHLYPYDEKSTRQFKVLLNYQLPYPILDDVLAEMFCQTCGSEEEFAERLYMSEEDLVRCQLAGCEIGIHSHRHRILGRLTEEEQRLELETPLAYFKNRFAVEKYHLAFPYGATGTWNDATLRVAKCLGYSSGLTVGRRIVKPEDLSNPWELPRFDVRDIFDADNNLYADKLRALFTSD